MRHLDGRNEKENRLPGIQLNTANVASFLAVGLGLVAWLVSYIYPSLLPQTSYLLLGQDNLISPQLSTVIKELLARENIVGLSLAVVPQFGNTEFHSWGYRTEDGDEVTRDTLFRMVSVSKAFCATAVGLLIDDFASGRNVTALPSALTRLTWKTRLSDLLPDWQLVDEWASRKINLRDVLSHMSGLPRHDFSYGPSDTPEELITRLRHLKPAFELREQFSYSNIMYMVATHIIATYAGQSYTSFVEERVFTPLGMASSTFSPTKADASGKLSQEWTKLGRRLPESFTEGTAFTMAGPAGVISNAVDMANWISMWIGQGAHNGQTVLPLAVYRNATCYRAIVAGHPTYPGYSIIGYGLGWYLTSYRGHDIIFHTGAMPGVSTLVSFLPADKMGVVLFANGGGKEKGLTSILHHILDSALHLGSLRTQDVTALNQVDMGPSPLPPNVATMESRGHHPTPSLDVFAGTYANPGYGSFTHCGPSSLSPSCAKVKSTFHAVDSVRPHAGSRDLFAEWARVWSSHVRLRHLQGHVFEIYWTSLHPNGYSKDRTPFETRDPRIYAPHGLAEFVMEDGKVIGFGVSGLIGQLTEHAPKSETMQDRVKVWFHKVEGELFHGMG